MNKPNSANIATDFNNYDAVTTASTSRDLVEDTQRLLKTVFAIYIAKTFPPGFVSVYTNSRAK